MLIKKEIVQQFAELVWEQSVQTAKEAHDYLKEHNKIYSYRKYPVKWDIFSRDDQEHAELFELISFLKYDIPKYEKRDFPSEFIDYKGIFYNHTKDIVDCTKNKQFDILCRFVEENPEIKKIIIPEHSQISSAGYLKSIINSIIERYLFMTKASPEAPKDLKNQLKPYVGEKLLRFFADKLQVKIYIPICLVSFDVDEIELSDNIRIIRMSEDIQKSRQYNYSYEEYKENWVSVCATHMIVMDNYEIENSDDLSINSFTQNYRAYPIQEIDYIMAAIRIVTGVTVGYEQVLCSPIYWIDSFYADLEPLYGAKSHFVNPVEIDKLWMHLQISMITKEQIASIKRVYDNIKKCEADKKKSVLFAMKRFNRCMLRNEEDDMATDATIGLEALLAGGTKSEITYTISNRIPIVFAHVQCDYYTSENSRAIMKKIYNYRSKIVHGGEISDKVKFIEINNEKVELSRVAVDFLRYTLLFVLEHQEFTEDGKFDKYIDELMMKKNKVEAKKK